MNKVRGYSRFLVCCTALLLSALAAGCGGDDVLGIGAMAVPPIPDAIRPRVTVTVPADLSTTAAANTNITATFTENMAPATITAAGTFTVCNTATMGAACGANVPGTVTYVVGSRTATFTPTPSLAAVGAFYKATITTAATDLAGNQLAGNQAALPAASNYVWSYQTGGAVDVTPPTVTSTNPADVSTGICLQKTINATFSEAMDPATLTTSTFTLQVTAGPGPILAGSVAYDAASKIATLTLTSDLLATTNYTATITTGAKDLAGNALAVNKVWTFTTGTLACVRPPPLGNAQNFGNLGGTAGSTNTGLQTVVNGDQASTATATSAVTGFHDSNGDIYTETTANKGLVTGRIYTCTVSTTGPTSAAINPTSCSIAAAARNDAITAYNTLAGLPTTGVIAAGLGGTTVFPGVYSSASGFNILGADLTLDAQGDANAVWVFQMPSTTLTVGAPGVPGVASRTVILTNGAQAKNVFWQVGTSATINPAGGGTMVGTILASSAVSFSTAGNTTIVTLNGRAAGLNASVTLVDTVINIPAP